MNVTENVSGEQVFIKLWNTIAEDKVEEEMNQKSTRAFQVFSDMKWDTAVDWIFGRNSRGSPEDVVLRNMARTSFKIFGYDTIASRDEDDD